MNQGLASASLRPGDGGSKSDSAADPSCHSTEGHLGCGRVIRRDDRITCRTFQRRMAPLVIHCQCGKTISVAERHRGRTIKCGQCGRVIRTSRFDLRLWVTLLAWAYLGAVALAAIILWGFGDRWGPATALLFAGRWVLLLPLAVLVPAALLTRRLLLAPLALGGLIALVPVGGFRFGLLRVFPHPAGAHLRVVTFNTDGGAALATRLPGLLEQWQADVVGFQECGSEMQEAISGLKDWHHHFVRQLCLLSRYPISDSAVMDRSALADVEQSSAGIGGSGDVVRYTLETPSGPVNVTNLHLETPRKGLEGALSTGFSTARLAGNTHLRTIESGLARRWVNAGTHPAIVLGDFNTPVESRIFQQSWGDLTDAFSRVGFGYGMTKNNGWIRVRIDHVLAGSGWYPDRATVGRDLGSDHLPLIVDLTLAPPQP